MTTFIGAATAKLFPSSNDPNLQGSVIDTTGTGIEQELMELIEESRVISPASTTSFVDSELEETNESPEERRMDNLDNTRVNSYGRPTAAILPTPRRNGIQVDYVSAALPPLTHWATIQKHQHFNHSKEMLRMAKMSLHTKCRIWKLRIYMSCRHSGESPVIIQPVT